MNGHPNNIDTNEATEHLKNILNVGKSDMESGKTKSVSNGDTGASNDNVASPAGSYQKIDLCVGKDSSHVSVHGTDVDVYSSPMEYGATCSQIVVENLVDYGWEEKYYFGKLVSIHLSGVYIAYVLKPANNKPGFVRITHKYLKVRHLIKDYKNEVKDIAFAHTCSPVLLGSVDACGELFVHKMADDGSSILCDLLIHVLQPSDWVPSEYNRIIWCLYIPDDNENLDDENCGDDVTTLLVVTHNERAEILNVNKILEEYGHGNLTIDEIKAGVQVITEHIMPITAATFSPDGTAVAIGSLDGVVKFYQVNIPETDITPRCLHQWIPHPDKSLSSLYFLDNHRNHRPDVQFWKIAITGAENNTELKIWSCETWTCLQTIKIHPNADDSVMPCLKAEMDLSSKYLFLSDIKRKVLLILLIQQESSGNALVSSISEYRVPLPVLSLTIASIGLSKISNLVECKLSDDEGEGDIEASNEDEIHNYMVQLYWIQTKTLQFCRILYRPKMVSSLQSAESMGSLSQDSYLFKDALSDISMDSHDISSRSLKDLDASLPKGLSAVDELSVTQSTHSSTALPVLSPHITQSYQKCTEVLLTPDDFTSPSHANITSQFSNPEDISTGTKIGSVSGIDSLPVEPCILQRRKSSQHSATSSPSREVAEILAPTKVLHLDDECSKSSVSEKEDVETITNNLSAFNITVSSGSPRKQQEYHMKDWPQAPDPSKDFRISRNEEDTRNHVQHFHSERGEPSALSVDVNTKMAQLSKNLNDAVLKLDSITDALTNQRCEIQSVQNEVKMMRQEQTVHQQSSKDTSFMNKFESTLSQSLNPHHSRMENLIIKKADEERRRAERDLALLSDEVSATFSNKLESTLKLELSNKVVPQINRVIDTIAHKLQTDFNQKLSSTDASLKETFTKQLKGKNFADNITQVLSASLQNAIQSASKDVFQNSVVPSFEKACHQMFQQMNEIFNKGTLEYMQVLEKQGQNTCAAMETTATYVKEEMNNLLTKAQVQLADSSVQLENRSVEISNNRHQLLGEIRTVVGEEVRRVMQQSSRAPTPVPASDPHLQKQHLHQLIRQGSLDEAFQQALSAMDVQLVLFVCENVSLDQVFGTTPCSLQQHVLLSLVNQLSADLTIKTDIKVKYIEDVISSLDSNNPIIRDHIQSVLENLQQRISNFLLKFPNHKLSRNLRRISLAINSLIKC